MSKKQSKKVTIHFPWINWRKCMHMMHLAQADEWSMLGNSTYDKETGVVLIGDCIMPEQKNFGSSTDMTDTGTAKSLYDLSKMEGITNVWIHSHVSMPAFWSGTDDQTMHDLAAGGYIVAVVMNKKGDARGCIYQRDPMPIRHDQIPVTIGPMPIPAGTISLWEEEFYDAVTNPQHGTPFTRFEPPVVKANWGAKAHDENLNEDFNDYYNGEDVKKKDQESIEEKRSEKEKDEPTKLNAGATVTSLRVADLIRRLTPDFVYGEKTLWTSGNKWQLKELVDMTEYRPFMTTKEISKAVENVKKLMDWTKGFKAKRLNVLMDLYTERQEFIHGPA